MSIPMYEVVKARVLYKVQDKIDPAKSRRMPESLLKQSTRQQVEQVVELEGIRLSRPDRERMVAEVISDLFGFGPLEELFQDRTVKEVLVLGPHAVLAHRDHGWVPTNVKFRDSEQLHETLEKVSTHGDFVGTSLPQSAMDMKLSNGFRVVAVIPPEATGQSPMILFVRTPDAPQQIAPPAHQMMNGSATSSPIPGSASAATRPSATGSASAATRPPGTGSSFSPATRPTPSRVMVQDPPSGSFGAVTPDQQFTRHKLRITERISSKLASLGVYDLRHVELAELRRVVAAYVHEYCDTEKVTLSDTDQGRLILEILTGIQR